MCDGVFPCVDREIGLQLFVVVGGNTLHRYLFHILVVLFSSNSSWVTVDGSSRLCFGYIVNNNCVLFSSSVTITL